MPAGVALLDGNPVQPGRELIDFRGEAWKFTGVSRLPQGGSTGRVLAERRCGHDKDNGECLGSYWCRGVDQREFFPGVFPGLTIAPTDSEGVGR